jgi:hypothetical protein
MVEMDGRKKRWWRLALLVVALVLVCVPLLLRFANRAPESKLTQLNLAKITTGMSPEQVAAILGPPTETFAKPHPGITSTQIWKNSELEVYVYFGADGRVETVSTEWTAFHPEPTWLDRVRSWLSQ